MIEYFFIFLFSSIFLFVAFYQDIKTSEIQNDLIKLFIAFSIGIHLAIIWCNFADYYFIFYSLINGFMFFIIGYLFFYFNALGGGDAKLLIGVGLCLPSNSIGLTFISSIIFLIYLLILGTTYYFVYKIATKRKMRYIPFAPVILLTFSVFYLVYLS